MALSTLLLAVWLILLGLTWAAVLSLSTTFLGWFAVVTGVVFLVEGYRPLVLPIRRTPQA